MFNVPSFRITRTSVNTDVLGHSREVSVNEVLLYYWYICCNKLHAILTLLQSNAKNIAK